MTVNIIKYYIAGCAIELSPIPLHDCDDSKEGSLACSSSSLTSKVLLGPTCISSSDSDDHTALGILDSL